MVLLTIGFCWAHRIGEWQHKEKPIPIKKHGRPALSLFRYGLNYLQTFILKFSMVKRSLARKLFTHLDAKLKAAACLI